MFMNIIVATDFVVSVISILEKNVECSGYVVLKQCNFFDAIVIWASYLVSNNIHQSSMKVLFYAISGNMTGYQSGPCAFQETVIRLCRCQWINFNNTMISTQQSQCSNSHCFKFLFPDFCCYISRNVFLSQKSHILILLIMKKQQCKLKAFLNTYIRSSYFHIYLS